nr:hypothetical protein [Tanacetum cinerariifolium]
MKAMMLVGRKRVEMCTHHTSANIVHDTPSPTDAETDKTNSEGDTKILNIGEEQRENVADKVDLEEKTVEIDEGQAVSDPGKIPESRPPPERVLMEEDQAGPNPRQSYMTLAGPDPEPMQDDFIATMYPQVHESLKKPDKEHVHVENPLSSTEALSSMKNLDSFTFSDQFFNDKPTEDDLGKTTMETKVESMVTVPIHQVLSSVPPLSTPVIDLTPLKPKRHKLQDKTVQALQAPLKERFRELSEADMKEIIHDRMFESGSHRSLPEHVAFYEALEASIERDNRDEFLAEKDKSPWKTTHTRDVPSSSSKKKTASQSGQPVKDVPILDDVHFLDTKDIDVAHLPKIKSRPDWLKPIRKSKLSKADLEGPAYKIDLVNLEGQQVVPDVRKLLPLGDSPAHGISHWWFKRKEFYINKHSASSNHHAIRSHMRILKVVSLKTISRYGYTYLKEIVLRRADYNEYKISEFDFKNLHPNNFEDLYLLHLQGKLNHLSGSDKVNLFNAINMWIRNIMIRKRVKDLQLGIESYQTKLNLTKSILDAYDFLFKEDYTIVSKPQAIIYKDKNDQKKMTRETEVHKFSDGTLTRILEKLDHMVKDFKLFKYNPNMETRIWS